MRRWRPSRSRSGLLCAGAPAAGAIASATSGGSPAGHAQRPNSSSACARGGVDSVRIPISWSAVQPSQRRASELQRVRRAGRGRGAGRASTCCRLSTTLRPGRLHRHACPAAAAAAPKTLPVKTGAQRAAWASFLKLVVARYGPGGSFWAANPGLAGRPDPHLADLERGELQVLRRPAQPGRIRQAGQRLLRGDQERRSRRQAGPWRHVRPAQGSEFKVKPPQAYFATDFLDADLPLDAGDQDEVRRRCPAPVHDASTSS